MRWKRSAKRSMTSIMQSTEISEDILQKYEDFGEQVKQTIITVLKEHPYSTDLRIEIELTPNWKPFYRIEYTGTEIGMFRD